MDIPFRPINEWEEGRHDLVDTAESILTFEASHQRIDLWLDTGGTTVHVSINPSIPCDATKPKLSADMGVHPILSGDGIVAIRFYSPSDLQLEAVNYRAK